MSTMTFKLQNGEMRLVGDKLINEIRDSKPKMVNKISKFSDNYMYSVAPFGMMLGATVANTSGSGVFWEAFMTYIFPWMLDIAKVFCAIKIAQSFYQEKRGGRDEGTGFGALVTYGKWYLVFWLIPWGVELIDQIGGRMLNDLQSSRL